MGVPTPAPRGEGEAGAGRDFWGETCYLEPHADELGRGPGGPRGGLGAPARAATGTAAEARGSLQRRPPPTLCPGRTRLSQPPARASEAPRRGRAACKRLSAPAAAHLGRDPHRGPPGLPPASFSAPIGRITLSTHEFLRGFRQDLTFPPSFSPVCPPGDHTTSEELFFRLQRAS